MHLARQMDDRRHILDEKDVVNIIYVISKIDRYYSRCSYWVI